MGGLMLPEVGFDEAGFRQEFFAVLRRGTANMVRNASDAESFRCAYENMDRELAEVTESFNPPMDAVGELTQQVKRVVETIMLSCNVDLSSLHMEDVRKTCVHLLCGIGSGNPLRLDKAYEHTVELLVRRGKFTRVEARELIAELSLLESRNIKDLLEKVGRSKNPGHLKFLQFVEANGGARAKEAAARAKEDLLSTVSKPPAKLLRLPMRSGPQPIRRIRQ
jgi:hypothetical protein